MALVGYGCYRGTFLWGAYPKDRKIVIPYNVQYQNVRCFFAEMGQGHISPDGNRAF